MREGVCLCLCARVQVNVYARAAVSGHPIAAIIVVSYCLCELVCLRALTQAYRPQFWYFEVIEMVKKVLLACIALLVMPDTPSQMVFALVVMTATAVGALKLRPYASAGDGLLAALAQWSLWLALFFGLLMRTKISDDASLGKRVFGVVLVGTQVRDALGAAAFHAATCNGVTRRRCVSVLSPVPFFGCRWPLCAPCSCALHTRASSSTGRSSLPARTCGCPWRCSTPCR